MRILITTAVELPVSSPAFSDRTWLRQPGIDRSIDSNNMDLADAANVVLNMLYGFVLGGVECQETQT